MGQRRNPAIAAGLLGAATLAVPGTAHALSLREVVDGVFSSPETAFAVGLAGGALATGVVIGTAALISRGRRARRQAPEPPKLIFSLVDVVEPYPEEINQG